MIRINLLGQARPKPAKRSSAVPLEATIQAIFLVAALVLATAILSLEYVSQKHQLDQTNQEIERLKVEKVQLQQVKADVDRFKTEKAALQERIDVIETLQRNRTGAQDLLQNVANTVSRVDQLWLTSLERKSGSLTLSGEAASISSIANFITQLRSTGYFDQIEIQTAKEDDLQTGVQTYGFQMTANIPAGTAGEPGASAEPTSTSVSAPPRAAPTVGGGRI